jgi:hypothetical protein
LDDVLQGLIKSQSEIEGLLEQALCEVRAVVAHMIEINGQSTLVLL